MLITATADSDRPIKALRFMPESIPQLPPFGSARWRPRLPPPQRTSVPEPGNAAVDLVRARSYHLIFWADARCQPFPITKRTYSESPLSSRPVHLTSGERTLGIRSS